MKTINFQTTGKGSSQPDDGMKQERGVFLRNPENNEKMTWRDRRTISRLKSLIDKKIQNGDSIQELKMSLQRTETDVLEKCILAPNPVLAAAEIAKTLGLTFHEVAAAQNRLERKISGKDIVFNRERYFRSMTDEQLREKMLSVQCKREELISWSRELYRVARDRDMLDLLPQ